MSREAEGLGPGPWNIEYMVGLVMEGQNGPDTPPRVHPCCTTLGVPVLGTAAPHTLYQKVLWALNMALRNSQMTSG